MSKPQKPSSLARSLGKSEELFHKHVKKSLIASHLSKTHVQAVEAKLNAAEKRGGDQGGATPQVAIDIDGATDRAATPTSPTTKEVAASLIDEQFLWVNFFSGIIDDSADAVSDYVEEGEYPPTHALEESQARARGEDRFAKVCHFPLKLKFTPLKRGRKMANTFASVLEMQFGALHASLQVGNVVLEWNDSHLVRPYLCSHEEEAAMRVDLQRYTEWTQYTAKQRPRIQKSIEGLDYGEQIELVYAVTSEKKKLIEALIGVIVQYNKRCYYNLFLRNCQHFVCDALKALGVELPPNFSGDLGRYFNALKKGRTPSSPPEFKDHSSLNQYVKEKLADDSIKEMPQHDLEFILAHYFRLHLESEVANSGGGALSESQCTEGDCYMSEVENLIDLQSMMVHRFRTIAL